MYFGVSEIPRGSEFSQELVKEGLDGLNRAGGVIV